MTDTEQTTRRPHLALQLATDPEPTASGTVWVPWSIFYREGDGACTTLGLEADVDSGPCEVGPYGPWDLFAVESGGHRWWTDRHVLLRDDVLDPEDPDGQVLAGVDLSTADDDWCITVTLPNFGKTIIRAMPGDNLGEPLIPVLSPSLNDPFEPKDPHAVPEAWFWARYAGALDQAGLLLDPFPVDDYVNVDGLYHFVWSGTTVVGCLAPLKHPEGCDRNGWPANGTRQITTGIRAGFTALESFQLPDSVRWDVAVACVTAVTEQPITAADNPEVPDLYDASVHLPPGVHVITNDTGEPVRLAPADTSTPDEAGDD